MGIFNSNSNEAPKLDASNLKVLQDQLEYEATMNKKSSIYANYCNDQELKSLCQTLANTHKQNYTDLFNYLNSHQ